MNRMVSKLTIAINIHNETPNINGFAPTDLSVVSDSPEPIRNSVTVIPLFESKTMKEVRLWGRLKRVFATIANIKKRMNQGIFIFDSFCLKKKVVAIERGIIQSARVSFTIVATSKALCP